jgi:hypothetical protein
MKDDLIATIHSHPSFKLLERALTEARPSIPAFSHREDNTDEWKANSLRREGFDLCLAVLKINLEKS